MATSKRRARKPQDEMRAEVAGLPPEELVDTCLAEPAPSQSEIRQPSLATQRLCAEFATFNPELRTRAVPVVVREYGWTYRWPALSRAEADAFARTSSTRVSLGDRMFLFGDAHAAEAGDLETFQRCLAIASAAATLQEEWRTGDEARAAVPVMSRGPEEARILGVLLDVPRTHACSSLLRQAIGAFLFRNERWQVLDQLAEGFERARGEASSYDLSFGDMSAHPERVEAIRARWCDAPALAREHMKPVWAAESEVSNVAIARFTSHGEVRRRLGTDLFFPPLPIANNRDPSSIAMLQRVTRQKRREELGTIEISAKLKDGAWSFEVLRFRGGDVEIDALS